MKLPHLILEVANVHGGNEKAILELIRVTSKHKYKDIGIKFQPFKYDLIALPDYSHYAIYKELFFVEDVWKEIVSFAFEKIGTVWLDLFDLYGVSILEDNFEMVRGIKLQASVLDNLELVRALSDMDLTDRELIINISGYEISDIERFIERFSILNPKCIILQIGFQGYPTPLEEISLNKISVLQAGFPDYNICFADHLAAEDSFALKIPLLASMAGCTYIEKHICLSRSEAKYDFYSALEPDEIRDVMKDLHNFVDCFGKKFISDGEHEYLAKSIQMPLVNRSMIKGQLVSRQDLVFRRTDQTGLTLSQIDDLQTGLSILEKDLDENVTVKDTDFKHAIIGVIVACRMKSTRLEQKAILPIKGVPSVERCLKNCSMFPNVDYVILATSTLDEDCILRDYTFNEKIIFWQGDPDDVIARYVGACDRYGIDIIIRVTGDCPVISPEIAEYLIEKHFSNGADYTCANHFSVGSASEIYNVEALKRVLYYLGTAEHSEYMSWYMRNNPDIFKVNVVDLPATLVRDYRLTLDYPEDLEMFEKLYEKLEENDMEPSLANVFKILDQQPDIPAINQHLTLRYKTDQALIDKLNRFTRIETGK